MSEAQVVDWRRNLDASWGIKLIAEWSTWREYRIDNPSASLTCRSMLMRYEMAILYTLAREHYSGIGAIVDAGPLTGVTTNVLAKGVLSNPLIAERSRCIYAFDLFQYLPRQETLANVPNRNGSLLDTYLEVNRDYLDMISIAAGDLLRFKWNSGPIEILMVDLAKSWDLNDFVVDQWFTQLTPGAYLIQQDYNSCFTYWLPITMMALQRHFEFVDCAMGGTSVFRCLEPVPAGTGRAIRSLPFERQEALLDQAIAMAPMTLAPVLITAKAAFYVAHQMPSRALEVLETVSTERKTEDYSIDFSAVAAGCCDWVRFMANLSPGQLVKHGVVPP